MAAILHELSSISRQARRNVHGEVCVISVAFRCENRVIAVAFSRQNFDVAGANSSVSKSQPYAPPIVASDFPELYLFDDPVRFSMSAQSKMIASLRASATALSCPIKDFGTLPSTLFPIDRMKPFLVRFRGVFRMSDSRKKWRHKVLITSFYRLIGT